jgi:hypothetical protein
LTSATPKIAATDIADVNTSVADFIVATDIADVISVHGYCDMITFILKQTLRSYPGSVLDVLHMLRKIMR